MVQGPGCAALYGVGALGLDARPMTIGTSHKGQSHSLLLTTRTYLMCNTMLCSRIDETIEVQWLTPHEEVEKYDHGVCQYLAYQAVLIRP